MTAFRLSPNPVGPGTVEIEGDDITDRVAGVQVDAAVGQPTVLTIHVQAGGVIEGDGIVQVANPSDVDDAEIICDFLANVDPALLEQEAFRRLGPGQMNTTAAALAVLADLARGQ